MFVGTVNRARWSAVSLAIALTGFISAANAGALGAPYQPGGIPSGGNGAFLHASTGANGESVLVAGIHVNRYSSSGSAMWPAPKSFNGASWVDAGTDRFGNSVIVVDTSGQSGLYATVYNRRGAVITPSFRVDQGTAVDFTYPSVSMNSDGVFIVTWTRQDSPSTGTRRSRVFDRNGNARGPEFVTQSNAGMALLGTSLDANGRSTHMSAHITPDFLYVRTGLTRFESNGNLVAPFTYITSPPIISIDPYLGNNQSGDQVIAWTNFVGDTSTPGIAFQRYSANGQLLGGNVVVDNSATQAYRPKVGVAEDGSFVVIWPARTAASNPNAPWGLYGRQYAKDGTALGTAFKIDDMPAGQSLDSSYTVAMGHAGEFTVFWQQYEGSQASLWARNYVLDNQPVVPTLSSGVAITGLSGAPGTLQYLKFPVPPGATHFSVTMSGAGDADMLIKQGSPPTLASFDYSPAIDGSNEGGTINNPPSGMFYIGLYGYSSYSDVSVRVDY